MRIGLREANQRFSRVVKAVKAGEEVVLTERERPIAVITPLPATGRTAAAVRRLEGAGLLRAASRISPMPPWPPRPIKGILLSETVREERDVL